MQLTLIDDGRSASIRARTALQPMLRLAEDDTLDGSEALPGFSCPGRDVFEL